MATSKRKRRTSQSKPTKRSKYVDSDNEASPTGDLWEAECILGERRVRGKLQYRIKWRGIDPATGDEYAPTWEPKENPTPDLVAAWEETKRATAGASAAAGPSRPKPVRKARVIESSPEPSTAHTTSAPSRPTTPITTPTDESHTTTPIGAPTAKRPSPKIHVGHRGDSFDPDEYEPFSQLAATQPPSSAPAHTQETELDSSQLFAARPEYRSSGIVPDSQSSVGEGSFIPATQQTTGTTQQSSTVNESQEEAAEDSVRLLDTHHVLGSLANTISQGLLEIVGQTTASRAPSPARSIPETVYDTAVDSQSQRRRLILQEHAETPSVCTVTEKTPEANNDVAGQHEPQVSTQIEDQSQVDQTSLHHPAPPSFPATLLPTEVQSTGVALVSEPGEPRLGQSGSQDIAEASPTEHSVPALDGAGPSPDLSHYPQPGALDVAQVSTSQVAPEVSGETAIIDVPSFNRTVSAQTEPARATPTKTSAAGPTQVSPNNAPHASEPAHSEPSLVASTQTEDELAVTQFIAPESTRSRSASVAQQTAVEAETVVQSTYGTVEEPILRRDFAVNSQTPYSPASRDQNAQVVPPPQDLSTQEETESIRPSVEIEDQTDCSTPDSSRHDSSQDTPERSKSPAAPSSSPIAQPPTHSLPALDSYIPPRPTSPIPTSSISIMATQSSELDVKRQLEAAMAKAKQNATFTPRTLRRSNINATPSATVPTPGKTPNEPNSSSNGRLLGTGASPSIAATDGTRSPSTIPDRSPAPSAPTSLRTIALTRATNVPAEEMHEVETTQPQEDVAGEVTTVVPAIVTTEPTVPEEPSSDNEVMSDASTDGTESLLNDDLQLDSEEHIVPLFIDGRQGDQYTKTIYHEKALLDAFARDRDGFEPFAKIEELLSKFHALETHFDLVFEEAGSSNSGLDDGASQLEFTLKFGEDNSAKFKFLHALIHEARDKEKHIVLLIENENELLLSIIETFCKACSVQYNMPTKNCQSNPEWTKGNLLVTIFPGTMSPIIRPPDVIICLDGVQDAKVIRQKNWARHPDIENVPVLHLVISRTVGHIERYLSSSLSPRERAHTIVASLGQMRSQLGKPIDEDMPRAPVTAKLVAAWLGADEYPRDWPLGSIGSVKEVIEFQTQTSEAFPEASPMAERTKRPHEEDESLDPAKRMRLTPQPYAGPSSSVNHDNDITRISDSMPSTALDMSSLRAQVTRLEEALEKERAARRAEQARHREQELAWDRQQTAYEDLTREYRILLGKQESSEEQVKSLTKNAATLRERLETRTMELRTRDEQLENQRNTQSLSEDAKIAEITKLRMDVAQAIADKERAVKSSTSADATLDYTKEQYRLAQEAATTSAARVAELETEVAKLSHVASGQPAELKKLHLNRQYEQQATHIKSLKAENHILKKTVAQKEDELQRAKMSVGRQGVGTRGTSVTPQPNKVRSRAASPATRLSNLRNG